MTATHDPANSQQDDPVPHRRDDRIPPTGNGFQFPGRVLAMMPFDAYPMGGAVLLGWVGGASCRREYGLKFMQRTGQTACAYCGIDLIKSYENWLQLVLDHVVPTSICRSLQVPDEWAEDCTNKVLSCAACNGFDNRYPLETEIACPRTLDEFYALRDGVFSARRSRIAARHESERAFFARRLWEDR